MRGGCWPAADGQIILLPLGTNDASDDGAGITVVSNADDVAKPVVNADSTAVTLAVPCKTPEVTLRTVKVWPAGIIAGEMLTIEFCEEVTLTGKLDKAGAGDPSESWRSSSMAGWDTPSAGS